MIEDETQQEPFTDEEKNNLLRVIADAKIKIEKQIQDKNIGIDPEKNSAILSIFEQIEKQLNVPAMNIDRKNIDNLFKELDPFILDPFIVGEGEKK